MSELSCSILVGVRAVGIVHISFDIIFIHFYIFIAFYFSNIWPYSLIQMGVIEIPKTIIFPQIHNAYIHASARGTPFA